MTAILIEGSTAITYNANNKACETSYVAVTVRCLARCVTHGKEIKNEMKGYKTGKRPTFNLVCKLNHDIGKSDRPLHTMGGRGF